MHHILDMYMMYSLPINHLCKYTLRWVYSIYVNIYSLLQLNSGRNGGGSCDMLIWA